MAHALRGTHKRQVTEFRSECSELTKTELDLVLLGKLSACMNTSEMVGAETKHKLTPRLRHHTHYLHNGFPVCPTMFRFLHTIGKNMHISIYTHTHTSGAHTPTHTRHTHPPPPTHTEGMHTHTHQVHTHPHTQGSPTHTHTHTQGVHTHTQGTHTHTHTWHLRC